MNILALVASPRKGSNTDTLIEETIKGCGVNGHTTEKIYLYLIVEMFRMSFDYLGMEFIGKVLATAYEKGEIRENQEELKKAYDFGISL